MPLGVDALGSVRESSSSLLFVLQDAVSLKSPSCQIVPEKYSPNLPQFGMRERETERERQRETERETERAPP